MTSKKKSLDAPEMSKIGLSEEEIKMLVKEYESAPKSSGKTQYLRYLHGEKLTYRETVLAKCFECCNGYLDDLYDCEVYTCPLHIHMAYNKDKESIIIPEKPEISLSLKERKLSIQNDKSSKKSSGKTLYLRYLDGKKLTYSKALLAKCAECTSCYIDGRYDCERPFCPAYNLMPYKGKHNAN